MKKEFIVFHAISTRARISRHPMKTAHSFLKNLIPVGLFCLGMCCLVSKQTTAEDALRGASWKQPSIVDVRNSAMQWIQKRTADEAIRKQAGDLWPADGAANLDVLDALAATFVLVEPRADALLQYSRTGSVESQRPGVEWLAESDLPPLVRDNLRLLFGRRLVQLHYFDEAIEQFGGLSPQDIADPAALLFYSGVAHHRLLHQEEGLAVLGQLLERRSELPARYTALATLMESDLRQLKDETLDHISRRMEDVERRLEQGRSGEKVREIEDGVVKSLDKLIKDLEDQQSASQGAASLQPSAPAQESRIARGKGEGKVTKKDIGQNTAWGDLPPKQRQEALQEIGRDFPANYRDVIEQYFRELAELKSGGDE
jgi:hypothetical protein